MLKESVEAFNQWRTNNAEAKLGFREPLLSHANLNRADLNGAILKKAILIGANLNRASLYKAKLNEANLSGADLQSANLTKAILLGANLNGTYLNEANLSDVDLRGAKLNEAKLMNVHLIRADLRGADLRKAYLYEAYLNEANLSGADLQSANLTNAHLIGTKLHNADLRSTKLTRADLGGAILKGANLAGADLSKSTLVDTNLEGANLTSCSVYGISAWNINLKDATQSNLVITPGGESKIQVDNLEVAQFIYLLLNNPKIRDVIDTITSKVVLILGRFTPERKEVLDAIRDQLRHKDYLPVLFDFEKPTSKNLTGTILTLANMARFIIADLTDPSSLPYELGRVVPGTRVPVQTIVLEGQREFAMFADLKEDYRWVLEPYRYTTMQTLLTELDQSVIAPAEAKAKELTHKQNQATTRIPSAFRAGSATSVNPSAVGRWACGSRDNQIGPLSERYSIGPLNPHHATR